MATKLYFHDANNDQSGTYPTDEQSAFPQQGSQSYAQSGASTLRKMSTTIGGSQVGPTWTSINNQTLQEVFHRMWTSPPLKGAQTVGGGNFILNFAHEESNTNMNIGLSMRTEIYVWRPSTGAKVGTLKSIGTSITGAEPGGANSERVWHRTGISTSSVSAADGDVIVVELYQQFTQGMNATYTGTIYYDGTTENTTDNATVSNHASFIEFAETLSFQSGRKKAISIGHPFHL